MQEAFKGVFKQGGEQVLKEFAPHAGRLLQKGDGSVMKTFNEVTHALKKL
jgi:hypothetical protein